MSAKENECERGGRGKDPRGRDREQKTKKEMREVREKREREWSD